MEEDGLAGTALRNEGKGDESLQWFGTRIHSRPLHPPCSRQQQAPPLNHAMFLCNHYAPIRKKRENPTNPTFSHPHQRHHFPFILFLLFIYFAIDFLPQRRIEKKKRSSKIDILFSSVPSWIPRYDFNFYSFFPYFSSFFKFLSRKSENRNDECLLAQERLHPDCARRPERYPLPPAAAAPAQQPQQHQQQSPAGNSGSNNNNRKNMAPAITTVSSNEASPIHLQTPTCHHLADECRAHPDCKWVHRIQFDLFSKLVFPFNHQAAPFTARFKEKRWEMASFTNFYWEINNFLCYWLASLKKCSRNFKPSPFLRSCKFSQYYWFVFVRVLKSKTKTDSFLTAPLYDNAHTQTWTDLLKKL